MPQLKDSGRHWYLVTRTNGAKYLVLQVRHNGLKATVISDGLYRRYIEQDQEVRHERSNWDGPKPGAEFFVSERAALLDKAANNMGPIPAVGHTILALSKDDLLAEIISLCVGFYHYPEDSDDD